MVERIREGSMEEFYNLQEKAIELSIANRQVFCGTNLKQSEFTGIQIDYDGMSISFEVFEYGDTEYINYYFSVEDLEMSVEDYSRKIEEEKREADEKKSREKEEKAREYAQRNEDSDRQRYEELKKKFENY